MLKTAPALKIMLIHLATKGTNGTFSSFLNSFYLGPVVKGLIQLWNFRHTYHIHHKTTYG